MHTLAELRRRLASAPAIPDQNTWVRVVPFVALTKTSLPDWLFTSGRPNRYNPAGVDCVYLAENAATARAEYDDYWSGLPGERQPVVLYYAELHLEKVLDLSSVAARQAMGIREQDLFASWRRAKRPTTTQLLGQAVSQQSEITGIRYPSRAAKDAGFAGSNIAIYRVCIRPPNSVRILGPTKKALQKWP